MNTIPNKGIELYNSELWRMYYRLAASVVANVEKNPVSDYCRSLFSRSFSLMNSFLMLQFDDCNAARQILLRSILELKIKASLYQDDSDAAIDSSKSELESDIQKFKRIINTGTSISAQILKTIVNENSLRDNQSSSKKNTIKQQAEKADLAFEYELQYWLSSLFVHSSSLSLSLERNDPIYQNDELFGMLNGMTKSIQLQNFCFLNTMIWITEYLYGDRMTE